MATDQKQVIISSNRLAAFTLPELIVVMIVSIIIISLIYTILLYAGKTWSIYHNDQQKITMMAILKSTIDQDIEQASYIVTNDEHTFLLVNTTDTIYYSIDSCITRKHNNVADTFQVKTAKINVRYIQPLIDKGIVSGIRFDITNPLHILNVSFNKPYCSKDLINL